MVDLTKQNRKAGEIAEDRQITKAEKRIKDTGFVGRLKRGLINSGKRVEKASRKPIKVRRITKRGRATLTIKEVKQAPYISTYFKEEQVGDPEMALFFK